MKIRTLLTCLLALTLMTASALAESAITITFTDAKAPKATETDSYAVNNAGAIAGDYIDKAGVQHGMILAGAKLTSFDGPSGSTLIAAYGINTAGAVVGWYNNSAGVSTAFMYAKTKFAPVAFPGAASTQANGINDNGWIVGSYITKAGVEHGFYWDTKKYHSITVKGAPATMAWAINNSNVITVDTLTAANGGAMDAYLLTGAKLTKIDVPGASMSVIHGIDTAGDLDYTIFDASANRHGVLFVKSTGVYTQYDDPKGVNSTRADGINDKLEMVGRYQNAAGAQAGFIAKTKP
jgi:probable HAF family extracellular repeat protein